MKPSPEEAVSACFATLQRLEQVAAQPYSRENAELASALRNQFGLEHQLARRDSDMTTPARAQLKEMMERAKAATQLMHNKTPSLAEIVASSRTIPVASGSRPTAHGRNRSRLVDTFEGCHENYAIAQFAFRAANLALANGLAYRDKRPAALDDAANLSLAERLMKFGNEFQLAAHSEDPRPWGVRELKAGCNSVKAAIPRLASEVIREFSADGDVNAAIQRTAELALDEVESELLKECA